MSLENQIIRKDRVQIPESNFYTRAFNGNRRSWGRVSGEVLPIYKAIFDNLLDPEFLEHGIRDLCFYWDKPTTYAVLLREKITRELVGFTYAIPGETDFNNSALRHREQAHLGLSRDEYDAMWRSTSEVGFTGIIPEHRGKGGWSMMMDALDTHLSQTPYTHMVRYVRVADAYAEKVKIRYGNNIIYEDRVNNNEFGEQRYFRIHLK